MPPARPIAVVDDDTDLRETIGELLCEEGYETLLFENGRRALDYLRAGGRPRLILLDLMMPEMDGWSFRAEQLSDRALREIPVVVMTASRAFGDDAISAQEILLKPVGLDELVGAVERNAR